MRLDTYLVAAGLAPSRTRAKEWIDGGFITVNGNVIRKPSFDIDDSLSPDVCVTGQTHPFVGRGGMKLDGALTAFRIDAAGKICADIGASTGGFTDCLLRRGAARVFAVDSGAGQLDPTLCADSRVVNIEHFNARNLTPDTFGCLCDMAVADLSFISQTYILPNVRDILIPGGIYVGLIKPQFECGRGALDRHGIVKSPAQHKAAITRVLDSALLCGLLPQAVIPSPITGGDGNREFLMWCIKSDTPGPIDVSHIDIDRIVRV